MYNITKNTLCEMNIQLLLLTLEFFFRSWQFDIQICFIFMYKHRNVYKYNNKYMCFIQTAFKQTRNSDQNKTEIIKCDNNTYNY